MSNSHSNSSIFETLPDDFEAPKVQDFIPSSVSVRAVPFNSSYELDDDLIESSNAMTQLLIFAGFKFIVNTIASPFVVANVVQQVQFKPSDAYLQLHTSNISEKLPEEEDQKAGAEENSEPPQFDEDDDYTELESLPSDFSEPILSDFEKINSEPTSNLPADESGYLTRTVNSFYSDPTTPPYQIPPIEGSSLGAISSLLSQQYEGFASLFKGNFTGWISDISYLLLQTSIEGTVNDLLELRDEAVPFVFLERWEGQLATNVLSHSLTGVILSPLEIVKTRLMVQTSNPFHKKYKSTMDCLSTMTAEEGGLLSLYFGPHFLPTLLHYSTHPFMQNATPIIIERGLGIVAMDDPVIYGVLEFTLGVFELLLTLPMDTVRRRLYCQELNFGRVSGKNKSFETVVERNVVPYKGMFDCFYRIVVEEGGVRSKIKNGKVYKRKRKGATWGLGPLFKGFRMRLFGYVIMQVLKVFADVEFE
ncbi:hypothetical protein HK098_006286 [Nowakowskiella sp. JEL0407]|nr:hypothetical protein HK098_006286 [Nowakowskiella sp. JEL0407]